MSDCNLALAAWRMGIVNADELRLRMADIGAQRTLAGRVQVVLELVAPSYTDGELDENGDDVVKYGEPLLTPEDALALLAGVE